MFINYSEFVFTNEVITQSNKSDNNTFVLVQKMFAEENLEKNQEVILWSTLLFLRISYQYLCCG